MLIPTCFLQIQIHFTVIIESMECFVDFWTAGYWQTSQSSL